MSNFKFFTENKKPMTWQGASWFWNGADGMGISDEHLWGRYAIRCDRGLKQFLSRFGENRIIPIHSIFHNNILYKLNNGRIPTIDLALLNEPVIIVYYDLIIN